jgi:hypothetical protein
MSVHTQVNDSLTITLGAASFECQFITATWRRPGSAAGEALNTIGVLVQALPCTGYSTDPLDLGGDVSLPAMTVLVTTTTGC